MRFSVALSAVLLILGVMAGCEDEKKEVQVPAEQPVQSFAPAEQPAPMPVEQTTDPDSVVVTVNGKSILEKEVAPEVEKRVQARIKMLPPGMEVPQERIQVLRDQTRQQVTEMLVDMLLIDMALQEKKIEITPAQAEAGMQEMAAENGITLEQMIEQFTRSGMTPDDVRRQFLLREKIEALINDRIGSGQISEEEAREYYQDHIQQFTQPELVTASHILLKTQGKTDEEKARIRTQMEEILKRAKDGEDFAALAKEYSEDPGSKDRGGEYTFPRGQMVKVFEDTAFALENGRISDIIETQFGYHIIKKTGHKEAGTQSFEEVKEQLADWLKDQKRADAWQACHNQLREAATIEWSEAEQARREAARPPMMPPQAPPSAEPKEQ